MLIIVFALGEGSAQNAGHDHAGEGISRRGGIKVLTDEAALFSLLQIVDEFLALVPGRLDKNTAAKLQMPVHLAVKRAHEILMLAQLARMVLGVSFHRAPEISGAAQGRIRENILLLAAEASHHLAQQLILVFEIAEEGDFVDPGDARDLAGRGAEHTVAGKNARSGVEDAITCLLHVSKYLHECNLLASQDVPQRESRLVTVKPAQVRSTPRMKEESHVFGRTPGQAAAAVILVITLFRLYYATWLPMLPDETYYFQWSRHLDASYFSKGPAVAYTIWLGTKLFGATNLGVRFFAVMLSAGTAWQLFLLARRWYSDMAGLVAVLIAGVIPLYAVGAVVMTIDPLSAFFWVWAANFFSSAMKGNRMSDWILAGFAVGSGFLAKYLNALELVAFACFVLAVPARRQLLRQAGFWSMLAVTLVCISPVLWWNQRHAWISAGQLGDRGHVHESGFHAATLLDFLSMQSIVVSPLIFVILIGIAVMAIVRWTKDRMANEGDLLLLFLFLSVFLFYLVVALHIRCEANWPAVSYLSLIALLAGRWVNGSFTTAGRGLIAAGFVLGWVLTVALHDTAVLHLPPHVDPMTRTAGWSGLAADFDQLRQQQQADVLVADAYKEASVISFALPTRPFIYVLPHSPPANQFDFWPSFPTAAPHRILWLTTQGSSRKMEGKFRSITPVESIQVWYRGQLLRNYHVYLCLNPGRP